MSLLGKILLVVNLLAAVGLVYLAAQDWGKRQAVHDVVLRYQLTLAGLPVDPTGGEASSSSVPVSVPVGPGLKTEYVDKKLFDAHFSAARGGQFGGEATPYSQADEVKAVQTKVTAAMDNQPGDAGAVKFLCGSRNQQGQFTADGLLSRLAETFEERAAIRRLAESQDVAAAKAEAVERLKRKFDAAINKPDPKGYLTEEQAVTAAQEKLSASPNDPAVRAEFEALLARGAPGFSRDEADRRRRIATLLMLVDPQPDQQKRAMLVCGLPAYLSALSEQTARVEEIARRTERGFEYDQTAFQSEYALLKRLALEQDQLVLQQKRVADGVKAQLAADAETVRKREGQKKELDDALAQLVQQVSGLLTEQQRVEAAILKAQQQVAETQRGNFQKEEQLKRAETGKR